jgi:PNKP adenylyltransferase domain, C-terminal region
VTVSYGGSLEKYWHSYEFSFSCAHIIDDYTSRMRFGMRTASESPFCGGACYLPGRLSKKRSLALREFALGIEALHRFVEREPLRRVHECVFGILALESEPVDPRL